MKKILSLALFASFLVLFGCGKATPSDVTSSETQPTNHFQAYQSQADNFSIQFPGGWTFQENVYGASVMFFSPLAKDDTLRENLGIVKKELDKEYTLTEYYTATQPELQKLIPNFTEVSNETIQINGIDAQKLIYKGTQGDVKLQREQVYLIKNKVVYIITYTATEDTFDEYIKDVDTTIRSLEFK